MIVVPGLCIWMGLLAAEEREAGANHPVGSAILAAMELAPGPKQMEREQAFEDLFRAVGAGDDQIRRLAVPEPPDKGRFLRRTRRALEELDLSSNELQAILLGEESRFHDLGNNVEVRLPGRGERVFVVAATLDAPGKHRTGIVDNWSACVLMSRLFAALKSRPLEHTVLFLGLAAEEQGCLGSAAYVRELSGEDLEKIDAMVLLDCLGMAPPSIWAQMSHRPMQSVTIHAAQKNEFTIEPRRFVDVEGALSDATPFRGVGIPTLFLNGLDFSRTSILHTAEETAEVLDPGHLQLTYRVVLDTLRLADQFGRLLEEEQVIARLGELESGSSTPVSYRLFGPEGPELYEPPPKKRTKPRPGDSSPQQSRQAPTPKQTPAPGASGPDRQNGARFAPSGEAPSGSPRESSPDANKSPEEARRS